MLRENVSREGGSQLSIGQRQQSKSCGLVIRFVINKRCSACYHHENAPTT